MSEQPMQPFVSDPNGTIRFRENKIVRALLDFATSKGMSLNEIAMGPFSNEDRRQLAQLIGYSLSGYHELSYVMNGNALDASAAARRAGFKDAGGCRDGGCQIHNFTRDEP